MELEHYLLKKLEYEAEIHEIIFLVSLLHTLKVSKETEKELLQTYYECLEQGKIDGFTKRKILVKERPNLYNLLQENKQLKQIKNRK